MNKTAFIPLEIKDRDLYPRLLIAIDLIVRHNFQIFFGYKGSVDFLASRMKVSHGGYLGLATIRNFENLYNNIINNSISLFITDEEGLVTYEDNYYKKVKISEKIIKNKNSFLFVWGKNNFNILEKIKKNNIFITGHPRLDLPKIKNIYLDEISEIKKKYNKFTLICTSFSYINYFERDKSFKELLKKRKFFKSQKDVKKWEDYEKIKCKVLFEIIKFIIHTSKRTNNKIVIRCHPSENKEIYQKIEKKYKNIFFEDKYSVQPWIICANEIVNHYCTTTFEAKAASKKVFSIKPYERCDIENDVYFKETIICKNYKELFNRINKSKNKFEKNKNILEKYAYNLNEEVLAYKNISDKINDHIHEQFELGKESKINFLFLILVIKFREIKSKIFNQNNKYVEHKIKTISKDEIVNFIMKFYGGKIKINCAKVSKNLFKLHL